MSKGLKEQKLEFNPNANEFVPRGKGLPLDQSPTALPVLSQQVVQPKVKVQIQTQDQIKHVASGGMDDTEMFHTTALKHQPQKASTAAPLRLVAAHEQQLQNGHSPVQNTAEHNVILSSKNINKVNRTSTGASR